MRRCPPRRGGSKWKGRLPSSRSPVITAGQRSNTQMSVMLVPFWNGLALTLGAALSNSTRERPWASLPVTTRRIGLMSLMSTLAPLERMEIRRARRRPRFFCDGVHVGDDVDHHRLFHLDGAVERA